MGGRKERGISLTGSLLGFDKARSPINADDETASNFGVQGTTVPSLLTSQDSLHPGNHLVGAGVARLVQIDNATADVTLKFSLQWRTSIGDGGEVAGSHKKIVIVLEQ